MIYYLKKLNKNIDKDKKLFVVSLCVIIFSIIANAYCWFDFNFSHDSTAYIQNDYSWQVSIGRYIHPFYVSFRGQLFSPFIVGVLSMIWLIISTFFLTEILKIKKLCGIILTSGIMSANSVITFLTATYIFELDIYMFSLMCSILAVYFATKYKKGFILSILLFALSLGIYQSYWQVGIIIIIYSLILDILSKCNFDELVKKTIKYLIALVGGIIVYYVGLKIIQNLWSVDPANSYNSLSNMSDFLDIKYCISLIIDSYNYFLYNTLNPSLYNVFFVSIIIKLSFIITVIIIILKGIQNKIDKKQFIFLLFLLFIIPLGGNVIYIISKGMEHGLMICSFITMYVFLIAISENVILKEKYLNKIYYYICIFTCFCIVFNSVIYSNQIYMKKHSEYEYTYSVLNRIIYSIEQQEEYEVGKTPVIFIGNLQNSKIAVKKDYYDYSKVGLESTFSVTYLSTYSSFINNIMSYPMNVVVNDDIINSYKDNELVKKMKIYPSKESVKMIDDYLIVKLSDE